MDSSFTTGFFFGGLLWFSFGLVVGLKFNDLLHGPREEEVVVVDDMCLDDRVINFGRHKGKTFLEAFERDYDYALWISRKTPKEECFILYSIWCRNRIVGHK